MSGSLPRDFDEAMARQLVEAGYGEVLQQVAIDCSVPSSVTGTVSESGKSYVR